MKSLGHFTKRGIPWNKGKRMSKQARLKMRLAKLGKQSPLRGVARHDIRGVKNPNFGKFGRNHPCWKEDKKRPFANAIRQLFKYRQWRSDIFTRDAFTCVLCSVNRVYVEADHYPKRFADILNEYNIKTIDEAIACEELWNINNGRTLCKKCHDKTKGRRSKDLTN